MKWSAYIALVFIVLLFFGSCTGLISPVNDNNLMNVSCDAEMLHSDARLLIGKNNTGEVLFNLGGTHSSKHAKSSRFSVLVDKQKPFAFTYELKQLKEGSRYKASIWRYNPDGKAGLIVAGDKTSILYQAQKTASQWDDKGWELLEIEFHVLPSLDYIKIYAWCIDSDSAWFDDFKIEQLPSKQYPSFADQTKIHLYFEQADWNILRKARQRAFENGILVQEDDDWVRGIISDEHEILPIKARLKGDWLDHLEGDKWSYRIKMRKATSLHGLTVFSLQNPLTRSNLMEYVAHELYKEKDVLTTRYGFTPLYVNGKSRGVYAFEEHFTKQLIEHNQRLEGPILKFSEAAFWGVQKYFAKENTWYHLPYFQAAFVEAFQDNKTTGSPHLKMQFSIAQNLLYQYKTHQKPLNQIFDLEKLAAYWALSDLTKASHGLAWHNQRFYYNPVLCLLEPIAFDNYAADMENFKEEKAIFGNLWFAENVQVLPHEALLFRIFQDAEFQQLYLENLKEISDETYLKTFFSEKDSSIAEYESLLRQEFENYRYDTAFIFYNARRIRQELPIYSKRLQSGIIAKYILQEKITAFDTVFRNDLVSHFVNAFYYETGESLFTLNVENYYSRPVELVGLADARKQMHKSFEEKTYRLKAYNYEDQTIKLQFESDSLATDLVFRVEGKSELLYAPLHRWEKQTGDSPRQELLKQKKYSDIGIFTESKDTIRIKTGVYKLNSLIIIPENKFLFIEKGVKLDMTESGGIISFSPIVLAGTEKQPIHLFSSDSSGQGLSVLKTRVRNRMEHVVFSNLRNFAFKGWELTGAVNFYEADIDMDYIQFEHNISEDALNIIRSGFTMNHCSFNATAGDAFDGDFVKGRVANTVFSKIANDAFDFSGSEVSLSYCEIKSAGDKGVSAGENSHLKMNHLFISNAGIAIASKDLSHIEANDIRISDCGYGLLAFQKKPEYGSASIVADQVDFTNVDTRYLIEKASRIQLNKILISGSQKKLARQFYED